jgi:deoxycytidylate deaminase
MENNFNKYLKIYNELKNLNTEKINKFKSFTRGFKMASKAAKKSTCGRKDVGAAIFQLNENSEPIKLLGVGYNGYKELDHETRYDQPVEVKNITCKEEYKKLAKMGITPDSDEGRAIHLNIMKHEIHAEDRAIQRVIHKYGDEKAKELLKNSVIFTTLSPCKDCSAMIAKYDIAVGGWLEKYSRDGGKGIGGIKKVLIGDKIIEISHNDEASEF